MCQAVFFKNEQNEIDDGAPDFDCDTFKLWKNGEWFSVLHRDDCDGSPIDFWLWKEHYGLMGNGYPEIPVDGGSYPMCPEGEKVKTAQRTNLKIKLDKRL